MKRYLILLALLLWPAVSQAQMRTGTTREGMFFCALKEDVQQFLDLATSGDVQAAKRFAAGRVVAGVCGISRGGLRVYWARAGLLSGIIRVHLAGDPTIFYAQSAMVAEAG